MVFLCYMTRQYEPHNKKTCLWRFQPPTCLATETGCEFEIFNVVTGSTHYVKFLVDQVNRFDL